MTEYEKPAFGSIPPSVTLNSSWWYVEGIKSIFIVCPFSTGMLKDSPISDVKPLAAATPISGKYQITKTQLCLLNREKYGNITQNVACGSLIDKPFTVVICVIDWTNIPFCSLERCHAFADSETSLSCQVAVWCCCI